MDIAGRCSDTELVEFVYDEARLLDEKRFDEWYELFTDDALLLDAAHARSAGRMRPTPRSSTRTSCCCKCASSG